MTRSGTLSIRPASCPTASRDRRSTCSGWTTKASMGSARAPTTGVEADAGETGVGLGLGAGIGDQDDRRPRLHDLARVLGEATVEPHVDRAAQVARRERLVVAAVDDDGAVGLVGEDLVEGQRRHRMVAGEQLALLAVLGGGEEEVEGCDRLALGDRLDEAVDRHRGERVVGSTLLADGRDGLGGEVLPARRAGAVGGEDPGLVGEGQQLVVQRVEELSRQVVGGVAHRGEEVGAADVADEERVAGQHAVRACRRGRARGRRWRWTRACDPASRGSRGPRRRARCDRRCRGSRWGTRPGRPRPCRRRSRRRSRPPARGDRRGSRRGSASR